MEQRLCLFTVAPLLLTLAPPGASSAGIIYTNLGAGSSYYFKPGAQVLLGRGLLGPGCPGRRRISRRGGL
jgi:hypothetical protein